MARFLRLPHKVEHDVVLRNIEIEIDLHAAFVRMGRHRVPDAARFEARHTHGKLARFQYIGMDELVDDAVIGSFRAAARHLAGLLNGQQRGPAGLVGRGRNHVEQGRFLRIVAVERDFLRTHGHVEAILVPQFVGCAVAGDDARAAHVEDADFPAFQNELSAEAVPYIDAVIEGHGLRHGFAAEHDHAVHMGIHGLYRVIPEQSGNVEFLADLFRRVPFHIIRVGRIANIHTLSESPSVS